MMIQRLDHDYCEDTDTEQIGGVHNLIRGLIQYADTDTVIGSGKGSCLDPPLKAVKAVRARRWQGSRGGWQPEAAERRARAARAWRLSSELAGRAALYARPAPHPPMVTKAPN
jgi:hypothetical protein